MTIFPFNAMYEDKTSNSKKAGKRFYYGQVKQEYNGGYYEFEIDKVEIRKKGTTIIRRPENILEFQKTRRIAKQYVERV